MGPIIRPLSVVFDFAIRNASCDLHNEDKDTHTHILVYMHACMHHACIHTCIHTYRHTHTYKHAYIQTRIDNQAESKMVYLIKLFH